MLSLHSQNSKLKSALRPAPLTPLSELATIVAGSIKPPRSNGSNGSRMLVG